MTGAEYDPIDPTTGRRLQDTSAWNAGIDVSSRLLGWNGLLVERRLSPPTEWPEFAFETYMICCNVNAASPRARSVKDGHWQAERIIPNQMFVLMAGHPLQTGWEDPLHQITIAIEPSLLARSAQEAGTRAASGDVPELIAPAWQDDERLRHLAMTLMLEAQIGGENGSLFIGSLAATLSIYLLKRYAIHVASIRNYRCGLSARDLQTSVDYVGDHLDQEISLDDLASTVDLSSYHFARLFKQSMGQAPYQYVISQRVEKAKALLLRGGLTIGEVAQAVGFYDQAHLIRHFKKLTGTTPGAHKAGRG